MKIVVLVKEVPDTWGRRIIDLETGLADRAASDAVPDEIGERATEFAVAFAAAHAGTDVIVLSMGPESAATSLRKGLALGASSAVHVLDARLRGADLSVTAEVLARAIDHVGFDLVVAGNLSTDGVGGVIPAMVAELLRVPHATNLDDVEIVGGELRAHRASDAGTATLTATLPAVVSVTERFPDPRFPTFKGIVAAKRKPLTVLSLDDLGIDVDAEVPRSIVVAVTEKPARGAGRKIADDGTAGAQLAEFLVDNGLA